MQSKISPLGIYEPVPSVGQEARCAGANGGDYLRLLPPLKLILPVRWSSFAEFLKILEAHARKLWWKIGAELEVNRGDGAGKRKSGRKFGGEDRFAGMETPSAVPARWNLRLPNPSIDFLGAALLQPYAVLRHGRCGRCCRPRR